MEAVAASATMARDEQPKWHLLCCRDGVLERRSSSSSKRSGSRASGRSADGAETTQCESDTEPKSRARFARHRRRPSAALADGARQRPEMFFALRPPAPACSNRHRRPNFGWLKS